MTETNKPSFARSMLRALMASVIVGFFAIMVIEIFIFVEPVLFPLHMIQGNARYISPNVIIGPYPQAKELERIRDREGVVEVISLLNPDVPVERQLLRKERRTSKAANLRFQSRPMSFISLSSKGNIRQAKELAADLTTRYGKDAKGKVYIHCYLGRHRVRVVTSAIKRAFKRRPPKYSRK